MAFRITGKASELVFQHRQPHMMTEQDPSRGFIFILALPVLANGLSVPVALLLNV